MTRVFESVIDATRAGLGSGEDWQFLGESSGDVGGGQLSCLPDGRIAHDTVPDDHLGARLEVQKEKGVMTAVMVKIGQRPGDTREAGEGLLEFVPDLDVYLEHAMCSCNASDDNPY
jgi:hypothetical protein